MTLFPFLSVAKKVLMVFLWDSHGIPVSPMEILILTHTSISVLSVLLYYDNFENLDAGRSFLIWSGQVRIWRLSRSRSQEQKRHPVASRFLWEYGCNCSDRKSILVTQGSRAQAALAGSRLEATEWRRVHKPLQTEEGKSWQSLCYVHIVVYITTQWGAGGVEVDRNRFVSFGRNRHYVGLFVPKPKPEPKLMLTFGRNRKRNRNCGLGFDYPQPRQPREKTETNCCVLKHV